MAAAAISLPQKMISWWAKEMRSLAPARVRADERGAVILELDGAGGAKLRADGAPALAEGSVQELAEAARMAGRGNFILRLPAAAVFRRTTTAPAGARHDLRRILALEIDEATPFDADDVDFDYLAERDPHDPRTLVVRQAIVKEKVVAEALQSIGAAAVDVSRVDAVGVEGVNLRRGARGKVASPLRVAVAALLAAVIALSIAAQVRQSKAIAILETQRDALEAETADIRVAAADARAALNNSIALNEKITSEPAPLEVLSVLTQLLPDDAWLTELTARHGQVTISGYGRSASGIIASIEASEAFEGVSTTAPITSDATGAFERYQLQFRALPQGDASSDARASTKGEGE